jgi:hypothetical protein
MRCTTHMARECPTSAVCELQGCAQPYGPPKPGTAVARERQPIDLDYKPGGILRRFMALADASERAVRRGPTPFAAEPPPPLAEEVLQIMSAGPQPLPPAQPSGEIRIQPIPGGWVIYVGEAPRAVATTPAELGARVAEMVQGK